MPAKNGLLDDFEELGLKLPERTKCRRKAQAGMTDSLRVVSQSTVGALSDESLCTHIQYCRVGGWKQK